MTMALTGSGRCDKKIGRAQIIPCSRRGRFREGQRGTGNPRTRSVSAHPVTPEHDRIKSASSEYFSLNSSHRPRSLNHLHHNHHLCLIGMSKISYTFARAAVKPDIPRNLPAPSNDRCHQIGGRLRPDRPHPQKSLASCQGIISFPRMTVCDSTFPIETDLTFKADHSA